MLFRFHILIRHDLAVSNTAGVSGFRAKVGVPRGTEGILFLKSTPAADQVLELLRRDLGVLGVLF